MTEQEWVELGRRAVACRGWRWLPGMRVIDTRTAPRALRIVVKAEGNSYLSAEERSLRTPSGASGGLSTWFGGGAPLAPAVPDLRDPATVGCLLALVREAYPNNDLYVDFLHTYRTASGEAEYAVYEVHDQRYIPQLSRTNGGHPTEAEALVAALEDAR